MRFMFRVLDWSGCVLVSSRQKGSGQAPSRFANALPLQPAGLDEEVDGEGKKGEEGAVEADGGHLVVVWV